MDKQACGGRGGEEMMGNELADNLSLPVIFAHTQECTIKLLLETANETTPLYTCSRSMKNTVKGNILKPMYEGVELAFLH